MSVSPGSATEARLALVEKFFAGTAGSYDFIVDATTLGADRRWKRRIVESVPPGATRILDLASGTGILTFALARRFSDARIVGVELRDEYLQIARRRARSQRIDNVEFVLGRAEDYVKDGPFDAVVSSYLAKYADLPALVRNAMLLLNPGGADPHA
jgi:demethylmenaquinone methyltransferase/2-methoxy-6-polyprenyl-1,4-benzoquinol methylase